MGSKSKKRVVLPSRPEPPTVEEILEDMSQVDPKDPVFSILDTQVPTNSPDNSAAKFQQVQRLLDLGERLRESGTKLRLQRVELETVGHTLQRDTTQVESQIQS